MLEQKQDQANCLAAQLHADRGLRRSAVVSLAEQQVERAPHGRQSRAEVIGSKIEQPFGAGENLLAAGDPFFDGRAAAQEGARDFLRPETAENIEDQCYLGFFREPRMAAREHHSQLLITNDVLAERLLDNRSRRPFGLEKPAQLRGERAGGPLTPDHVEGTVLRRRHQPRRRVLWNAAYLPDLQRATERLLHDVLGQGEIVNAEDSGECRHKAPRLAPKEVFVHFH